MVTLTNNKWIIDNIDTVLFDKDGTFLDFHLYWGKLVELRSQALIDFFGINPKNFEKICLDMGYCRKTKKLTSCGPVGLLSRDGVIKEIMNKLTKFKVNANYNDIDKIFKEVHEKFFPHIKDYCRLIDGVEDCLIKLKELNVKLAVVTSDTHKNTIEITKNLKINTYFDLIVGKDDCKFDKKSGLPAKYALRKLKSNEENTITIGDGIMDFLMAQNAGLKSAVLVATGQTRIEELSNITNYVVNNLKEVIIK